MALGLLETNEIVCSGITWDHQYYMLKYYKKDGVGGASFASSELTTNSLDDRPVVQVGDPFIEKSLIEAVYALRQDVIAAQDMAAGLT